MPPEKTLNDPRGQQQPRSRKKQEQIFLAAKMLNKLFHLLNASLQQHRHDTRYKACKGRSDEYILNLGNAGLQKMYGAMIPPYATSFNPIDPITHTQIYAIG